MKAGDYLKDRKLNYKGFRISGQRDEAITIPQIMEDFLKHEVNAIKQSDDFTKARDYVSKQVKSNPKIQIKDDGINYIPRYIVNGIVANFFREHLNKLLKQWNLKHKRN